jgi:hypothetical protein
MNKYFLGCAVTKDYADFIILDSEKRIVENNFQLDDTFNGQNKLESYRQVGTLPFLIVLCRYRFLY